MLDAIAGLSVLGAGVMAPPAIRRAYNAAAEGSSVRPIGGEEDRYEPGVQKAEDDPGLYAPSRISAEQGKPAEKGQGTEPVNNFSIEQELTEAEAQQVQELKQRDNEVRTHEQSHQSAGGQYAGSASYSYETGPDGQRYAVEGEVSIDVSPVAGDPQATIAKMQQIRRAALAPAQPSSADRQVAAKASQLEQKARAEMARTKDDPEETDENQSADERATDGPMGSTAPNRAVSAMDYEQADPAGRLIDMAV